MATLAFAAAGAALGSAVLPAGISILGATISGAALGAQAGALAGSYVDQALFGSSGETQIARGPRLTDIHILGSSEGAPVPRVYGRARIGGQIIWADKIEEEVVRRSSGGGGGKGAPSSPASVSIEYRYYASFAVGLCEGEINRIERIWADERPLNLSRVTYRVHPGSEDQLPDSLIEARLGIGNAPAFRGLAYIVFDRLPLRDFGNRIPQLSFQVQRSIDSFTAKVRGMVLIPGSGEFAYSPVPVDQDFGGGYSETENVHTYQAATDWAAAIDQLETTFPGTKNVSLVVSWFGTDLRAGECEIKPGVERDDKTTKPISWSVAGVTRASAYVVSQREGRAAYGGTPSDQTVVQAIQDLKARGFAVTFNPFILMDVADDNTLPDPYSGSAGQPPYPWRGRITLDPAPGQAGSPDKTPAAATQINAIVGTAAVEDFAINGTAVTYGGPVEWSLRRMVLHYAHLALAAGGVDAFLIGSELRGLTWARDGETSYPLVTALTALAGDVKNVLGPSTKVTYGADWSEYFGHQPQDGTGDVYFHLDPLWSSNAIDAVGIDVYWPLADWRDGTAHLDQLAGVRTIYDDAYLRSNVTAGEGFDWYYASVEDRDNQVRTQITDGAGKPWIFRYKDIKAWWSNQHFNRPGGVESATPTSWVPESKPFWFTETGCPAVDRGANQPNVFSDPKSSENALPYYSRGTRDDLIQRRYLGALIGAFDPADPAYLAGTNPLSSVYAGRMVDLDRVYLYTWDARPYPAFPFNTDVWGDGENWRLGHWLTGRAASGPLAETVERILDDYEFADHDTGGLFGTVTGYLVDRVMSPRDALQPLALAYFFDSRESGASIIFTQRGDKTPVRSYTLGDLVEERKDDAVLTLTRAQETELPASAKVRYIANRRGFEQAVADARRLVGASGRVAQADLPIVLEPDHAARISETWLHEAWSARERARFAVPPSSMALEPGDVIEIETESEARLFRITETGDHGARAIDARSFDREIYGTAITRDRNQNEVVSLAAGGPDVAFLDLPLLRGDEAPDAGYVTAVQTPWPGGVAFYGSPETTGYVLRALAEAPATMGTLLDDMPAGPEGVFDYATRVRVRLFAGELASVSRLQLFAGQNLAAVATPEGEWEVFQFETASLTAASTYELSVLLRGQAGTEGAMRQPLAAGAVFVLLTAELAAVDLTLDELRLPYHWRYGPADRDIGDASFADREHTFQGVGLRPYSPVHIKAVRSGNDIAISWIRRTRIGGDTWDTAEVPLGEASERYEVDILDGATVKRTLATDVSSVIYAEAEQVADFGSVQANYSINVYQLSEFYGRGAPRAAVVG